MRWPPMVAPRSSPRCVTGAGSSSLSGASGRSSAAVSARRTTRASCSRCCDPRSGLARELGLDPATPFERVLVTLAAQDRGRAARARAIDYALAAPLPDDRLLRTVASIEKLLAEPQA